MREAGDAAAEMKYVTVGDGMVGYQVIGNGDIDVVALASLAGRSVPPG